MPVKGSALAERLRCLGAAGEIWAGGRRQARGSPIPMNASAEKGTTLKASQERIRKPLHSFISASRHGSQIRHAEKRSSAITRHSPRPDTAIGQVDADPSAV